jgi:hypothetical protein
MSPDRLDDGAPDADAPAFDQDLLLWLGDEAPSLRAKDAERIREIAAEFAMGFDALSRVSRAVTIFGSARGTPERCPSAATSSCPVSRG